MQYLSKNLLDYVRSVRNINERPHRSYGSRNHDSEEYVDGDVDVDCRHRSPGAPQLTRQTMSQ